MKNNINLLLHAKVEASSKTQLSNIFKIISVASIGSVLLISFILFILARQLSLDSIREKQNAVIKNINFLKEKQAKLIVSNQKIEEISKIIKNRTKFDNSLRTIYSKVPVNVSFQSLKIDKQKISINLGSNSLISINEFIDNFAKMAKSKKLVKDFTIENITLDPTSRSYNLNIEAQML